MENIPYNFPDVPGSPLLIQKRRMFDGNPNGYNNGLAETKSKYVLLCFKAIFNVWVLSVCVSTCIFERTNVEKHGHGQGIAILIFGTLLSGSVMFSKSRIPCLFPCPDVFVCPFLIMIDSSLHEYIESSDDERITLFVAFVLSSIFIGLCLIVGSKLQVYKFVGFFPYPILCSFAAAIGATLIWLSWVMVDGSSQLISMMVVTLFGASLFFMEMKGWSLSLTFPCMAAAALLIFYMFLVFSGLTIDDAIQQNWLLDTSTADLKVFTMVQAIASSPGTINWFALLQCWQPILALGILYMLKHSLFLQDVEFELGLGKMMDHKYEMKLLGVTTMAASFGGATTTVPYLSLIEQLHFFEQDQKSFGLQVACMLSLLLLVWVGPLAARFVPRIIFSGFLFSRGLNLVNKWGLRVVRRAQTADAVLIFSLLVSFVVFGLMTAVGLGLVASILVFVFYAKQVSVIRTEGTGLEWRSLVRRSKKESTWLDNYGDLIRVINLQGVLFFGNSNLLFKHVKKILQPPPERSVQRPQYLIFDTSLVLGIDASAMDALSRIAEFVKKSDTRLIISGALPNVSHTLKQDNMLFNHYIFMPNLDQALANCEWLLLKKLSSVHAQIQREAQKMKSRDAKEGFMYCLKEMQKRFSIDTALLEELAPYVSPIALTPGDVLFPQAHGTRSENGGLYFIEHGFITVQREPTQEIQGNYCVRKKDSLPKLVSFRIATISTGFCIGAVELSSGGRRSLGVYRADTYCRVHFLPFSAIEELEPNKPKVILCLHKLMGCMISNAFDHVSDQLFNINSRIYT